MNKFKLGLNSFDEASLSRAHAAGVTTMVAPEEDTAYMLSYATMMQEKQKGIHIDNCKPSTVAAYIRLHLGLHNTMGITFYNKLKQMVNELYISKWTPRETLDHDGDSMIHKSYRHLVHKSPTILSYSDDVMDFDGDSISGYPPNLGISEARRFTHEQISDATLGTSTLNPGVRGIIQDGRARYFSPIQMRNYGTKPMCVLNTESFNSAKRFNDIIDKLKPHVKIE